MGGAKKTGNQEEGSRGKKKVNEKWKEKVFGNLFRKQEFVGFLMPRARCSRAKMQ